MKKILLFSATLAMMIAAVSCEREVVETDFNQTETLMVPVTLTGSIPDTRVTLDGVTPKWNAGDRLTVFTTDGTLCPAFTADQGGSRTTTFSGTKPDGSTLAFALFPYSASASCSGGSYTFSLPATQDGTLGSAVMAAAIPAGEGEMVFANLCNVVKVHIPSGLSVAQIELIRDDRVSGTFTVNGSTLAVTPAASPADADKRVVVKKASGSFSNEDVLISVLPSTSKKIDLILTNAAGKTALVSKDLSTAYTAGHIKNLGDVPTSLIFSDVAKIGGSTASQQYAQATQINRPIITNGGFEDWTTSHKSGNTTYYKPDHFNSFKQAEGTLSGMAYSSSDPQINRTTDRHSGDYALDIWSRKVWGVVAQGNATTGCIYASSMSASGSGNYNYTKSSDSNKSMAFNGRPKSLSFWAKFVPVGSGTSYVARVAAYLHDKNDFRTLASGSVSNGTQLGIAEQLITKTGSWIHYEVDFVYSGNTNTDPSYILVNIMTNQTPGGGGTGDHLIVDDLEVIYPDTFNVKTDSNGWATMYVDFNALVPSGATAYYVNKVAAGYARLVAIPAGSVIPKNTGILIKGSANTQYTFDGSKNTAVTVTGNLLQGTLTSISKPGGTCRVLSSESTSSMAAFGAFTGSTIAANTAYLTQ